MANVKNLEQEIDQYLQGIYYRIKKPASYSGAAKIWNYIKKRNDRPVGLTYSLLKKWLQRQLTHNIHKYPARKFEREPIIVETIDEIWDMDLLSVTEIARFNRNFSYIVICIDLFSRYCWARAIKKKTADQVLDAFKSILKNGRQCITLRTDGGSEFLNKQFQLFLKRHDIVHVRAFSEKKASYAERMNLTLQRKLYKYFYEQQTYRYIDVLQDIVKSYNATVHSTIGVAPKDVNLDNALSIYMRVYLPAGPATLKES